MSQPFTSLRLVIALATTSLFACIPNTHAAEQPNFIVIFCDDVGYGDLGCFGHPSIHTPNLDRMAREGQRWTDFYAAASVCTPSRAGLITGRLPVRSGLFGDKRRVLFPNSPKGIPAEEITIAEQLQSAGYQTACVGKWHLGHLPEYLPTRHGFDSYFGIPYSNDMDRVATAPRGRAAFDEPKVEYWNVPLLRDETVVERPADQNQLTRRYTDETVKLIRERGDAPFFIYLAHSMAHVPLFRSEEFANRSLRGLYGDVMEEIDESVGRILSCLQDEGIDQSTLVIFTSDNGPWLIFDEQGGSAGLLKDGKGCTWEGGMREPTIAWWPGTVPAGQTVHQLGSTLDLFATFHNLANIPLPEGVSLDSYDLSDALRGVGDSKRDRFFYYRGSALMAARVGPWKAHYFTQGAYGPSSQNRIKHEIPQLFHLGKDPGEQWDRSQQNPTVLQTIQTAVEEHQANLVIAESQLD